MVDAVRRNFEDDLAAVVEMELEGGVDLPAVQGNKFHQLRRRARPVLHDPAERLPGDVNFSHRHRRAAECIVACAWRYANTIGNCQLSIFICQLCCSSAAPSSA